MKLFPSAKTFLAIGPFNIQWYAICIMTGAFIAYYLSLRNTRKLHYPDDFLSNYFVSVLWIGIIGARIWYCLFDDLTYFLANPIRLLQIYQGGLAIHGGVIAGSIYTYFFCKKQNISFLRFADAVLPNVLVAQAIGRWGNFINQEAHGPEVAETLFNGPLSFLKNGMYIDGHYYEPTFFYESVANIIGFVLIHFILRRRQNKRGDLAWAYLMWYGVVRFFIETRRTDALFFGSFRIAQIISLMGILIGITGYFGIWDRFLPKRKASILFDLDGTLVNTEPVIIDSYRSMFQKRGREAEFTHEKALSVLGPSLPVKMEEFFPDEDVDDLMDEYRQYQTAILAKEASLMPHVIEMLEDLQQQAYPLGIVTARMHDSAEHVLEVFHLEQYFSVVVAKDDCDGIDKPNPVGIVKAVACPEFNRDDVVYVGDSFTDILAGKNYGAYTVGYYFNQDRKEVLKQAKADCYLHDFASFAEDVAKIDFSKKV